MKATISTHFDISADKVWSTVKQSKTLTYITKGLLSFKGAESFPIQWQAGHTETSALIFFGFIPAWRHTLHFVDINNGKYTLSTEEQGGLIKQWDHVIRVKQLSAQHCQYTDEIEIKAGLFTPFVWLIAHAFYRYRQFRWKGLIRKLL